MVQATVLAVVLIVAVKLWVKWYNSPARIGRRGERRVTELLRRGLPAGFRVIDDVYLPLRDGTTTQIDNVIVGNSGIFVIEVKTYSGWIFGDARSRQWTQTIYRKKSRFQNPIHQNYRHKCALSECLGVPMDLFRDIVVFMGDCQFKTEMPPEVMHGRSLLAYIRGFTTPLMKDADVERVASVIREWSSSVDDDMRKRHVENLRKRHSSAI